MTISKELQFERERDQNIEALGKDQVVRKAALDWMIQVSRKKYFYNFSWMGRPIIQFPQDIIALQEIIWKVRPDFVIETGIAHGGSLIFLASMLELIGGPGEVLGIDIEIRAHNRAAVAEHPMFKRITMIEGSSINEAIVEQVFAAAEGKKRVLVILDSSHTHEHVLKELHFYSPLPTKGSYLVVFDTIIEDFPAAFFVDRPWGPGNNPKTAVRAFLETTDRFEIDREMDAKLSISAAPNGYLKCIKD